jgi:hypothetical protein
VKRCLAEEDLAGLSDTLAYDMTAAADEWVSLLRALAGSIETCGND